MILRSVVVRQVKGIREARYERLSDSLNLFFGPNESGKTTIVEALHFALFERSAGEAEKKRALRTWGATGTPEVEVVLEDEEGVEWFIHKRFLDQPQTTVDIGSAHLVGEAAEARLRAALGTRPGNKYGVDDRDLGIWPLLWVRQGEAGRATGEAMTPDARARLHTTLSAATGAAAIGDAGLAVLQAARAADEAVWTPQGRPRGALQEAIERRASASARVADLADRKVGTEGKIGELSTAEAEVAALTGRRELLAAEVDRRRASAGEAGARRAALDGQASTTALAALLVEQAEAAVVRRASAERAVREAETVLNAATSMERRANDAAEAAGARRAALAESVKAAESAWTAARAALAQADRGAQAAAWRAEVDALTARIDEALGMERALRAAGARVASSPVGPDVLARLEGLAAADAERPGVSVVVRPLVGVSIDGVSVPAGAAVRRVAGGRLEIVLDGVAVLVVESPVEVVDRLGLALAELGLPDLAAARAAAAARAVAAAEVDAARARLRVVAPEGVAPLQEVVALREVQLAAVTGDVVDPGALRAAEAAALSALASARAGLEQAEGPAASARAALVSARTERASAASELGRRRAVLAELPSAERLGQEVERTAAGLASARAAEEGLRGAFEAAGGEAAASALASEERALAGLDRRLTEASSRWARLRAEVDARLGEGLADALADARADLADATAAEEVAQASARGVRAAREALDVAAAALQDRLAGPVRAAVADLLGTLFPGASLAVDPVSGEVIGLTVGRQVERFADLSAGAREQLGVLVRLGLARVLSEGRRLPVLLDDALVHSDAQRRGRMVELLRDLSAELQVLVFTCHDEDFDRLAPDRVFRVAGRPGRA